MSYYRHYWYQRPSQREVLSGNIGGIDHDIINYLFGFDDDQLARFFQAYEDRFDRSAASYARREFEAWRSGTKKYNVKTVRKIVQVVPLLLTNDQRYDLLRKLYEKTRHVETHRLRIVLGHSEHKFEELDGLFQHLCSKPTAHKLSPRVLELLEWVSNHDSERARQLMAAVETEHSAVLVRAARLELERLHVAIRELDTSAVGTHEIRLPYGTVVVEIRHPTIGEQIGKFFRSL